MIGSVLFGLALLSLALIPLETMRPGVASQRRFRRGWLLDVVYWFFTALITKPISKIAVVMALLPILILTGSGSFENLLKGHGLLGRQSSLAQAFQMTVLIDFIGYWLHRAFHGNRLWRFTRFVTARWSWIGYPPRACIR